MLPRNSDKRNVIGMGSGVTNFDLHVINFGHCWLQFHVDRDESLADQQTVRGSLQYADASPDQSTASHR